MKRIFGIFLILSLMTSLCRPQEIPHKTLPDTELNTILPSGEINLFQVIPFYESESRENSEINYIGNSGIIHFRNSAAEIRANRQMRKPSPGPEIHLKFINKAGYIAFQEKNKVIFRPQDKDLPVISLDLNKKELIIAGELLAFNNPIEVNSADNAFHSAWKGYSWESNKVKLCLGRLQQSQQLFLQIRLSGRNNDLLFIQKYESI